MRKGFAAVALACATFLFVAAPAKAQLSFLNQRSGEAALQLLSQKGLSISGETAKFLLRDNLQCGSDVVYPGPTRDADKAKVGVTPICLGAVSNPSHNFAVFARDASIGLDDEAIRFNLNMLRYRFRIFTTSALDRFACSSLPRDYPWVVEAKKCLITGSTINYTAYAATVKTPTGLYDILLGNAGLYVMTPDDMARMFATILAGLGERPRVENFSPWIRTAER